MYLPTQKSDGICECSLIPFRFKITQNWNPRKCQGGLIHKYVVHFRFWFQLMTILSQYGVPFHAVIVFRTKHDFLSKSESTYCVLQCVKRRNWVVKSEVWRQPFPTPSSRLQEPLLLQQPMSSLAQVLAQRPLQQPHKQPRIWQTATWRDQWNLPSTKLSITKPV